MCKFLQKIRTFFNFFNKKIPLFFLTNEQTRDLVYQNRNSWLGRAVTGSYETWPSKRVWEMYIDSSPTFTRGRLPRPKQLPSSRGDKSAVKRLRAKRVAPYVKRGRKRADTRCVDRSSIPSGNRESLSEEHVA